MNYLAHLYLAQPNADSHFGNLLGDFGGHRHTKGLSDTVKKGLENHYLVDRYTDKHVLVKQAKQLFSPHRKRFAGIAVDVLFDHFLIRHWQQFHNDSFEHFKQNSYRLLNVSVADMPHKMQYVVTKITTHDWFSGYINIEGVGFALDNIAKRIRFSNQFQGAIEDIDSHYEEFEEIFLDFFPSLVKHVELENIENNLGSLTRRSI